MTIHAKRQSCNGEKGGNSKKKCKQCQKQEQHRIANISRLHLCYKSSEMKMMLLTMFNLLIVLIHGCAYVPSTSTCFISTRQSIKTNQQRRHAFSRSTQATISSQRLIGSALNNNNNNNNIKEKDDARKINKKDKGTTPKKPRRTPSSKKVAIKWIIESVGKCLQLENNHDEKKKDELMDILWKLYNAKNTRQITMAGSTLESIYSSYSYDIQERLLKITSSVGLTQLSIQILQSMLSPSPSPSENKEQNKLPYIPSPQSYTSLLNTLRKRKMLNQMKIILHSLAHACNVVNQYENIKEEADSTYESETHEKGKITTEQIDIFAINTYIAALCDAALYNSDPTFSNNYRKNKNKPLLKDSNGDNNIDYLAEATSHVLLHSTNIDDAAKYEQYPYLFSNKPDLTTYNTILHTAAKLQNETTFQNVYSQLLNDGSVEPDIYTYNARLKLYNNLPKGKTSSESDNEIIALEIMEELQSNPKISPDKYTIDLALIPLTKAGYVGLILRLLEDYVLQEELGITIATTSNSTNRGQKKTGWNKGRASKKDDAFASFLNTLVKANEIEMAQTVFDTFLMPPSTPSFSKLSMSKNNDIDSREDADEEVKGGLSSSSSSVTIQPSVRHFNTLIDGYKRLVASNKKTRQTVKSRKDTKSSSSFDVGTDSVRKGSNEEEKEGMNDASSSSKSKSSASKAKNQAMNLFLTMLHLRIPPDAYTISSIMGLLTTSDEISTVYRVAKRFVLNDDFNPIVYRSIMTAYGRVEDPSSAAFILDEMEQRMFTMDNSWKGKMERLENWNVLLVALSKGSASFGSRGVLSVSNCSLVTSLRQNDVFSNQGIDYEEREEVDNIEPLGTIGTLLEGKTCAEAAAILLDLMTMPPKVIEPSSNNDNFPILFASRPPKPNTQTFTLVASTFSHDDNFLRENGKESIAMELYRNATTSYGIPADGRFVNAIIRCFSDDIDGAIKAWKDELGRAARSHENRPGRRTIGRRQTPRKEGKNLLAGYHGLMHVCGRAGRPDVALRLVYAMNKEGIEPTENALKCYESGKRILTQETDLRKNEQENIIDPLGALAKRTLPRMANQYESLLVVECTKYDAKDKRRSGEQRVRIIF